MYEYFFGVDWSLEGESSLEPFKREIEALASKGIWSFDCCCLAETILVYGCCATSFLSCFFLCFFFRLFQTGRARAFVKNTIGELNRPGLVHARVHPY